MFWFSPVCILANFFKQGTGGKPQAFHGHQLPLDNLKAGEQWTTSSMHDGVGEEGTKLSPSLQGLGHGFLLATVPKQQTASVGKGHKKFSSPLLKPSGSYKKNPTGWLRWLVAPPPCFSSHFSSAWWHSEMPSCGTGLPQAMVYPALSTVPADSPVNANPTWLSTSYLGIHLTSFLLISARWFLMRSLAPPNGFSRSGKPIGQIGPSPARGVTKPAGEVEQGQWTLTIFNKRKVFKSLNLPFVSNRNKRGKRKKK